MSDLLNSIDNLPDISFIDNMTLEEVQNLLITSYQEKITELSGKPMTLSMADPCRLILLGCAQLIYQGLQMVDKTGKMNFYKYAYGNYLENISAWKGVARNDATYAYVPIEFCLSAPRESSTGIPEGTRVTSDNIVFFATTEYTEIPAGEIGKVIMTKCTEPGIKGNGFDVGEINVLVDTINIISSVSNTQASSGGSEIETDNNLAERAYLAPSSYSATGTESAYEYWIRNYNQDIADVMITSPSPGLVDIRFVMKNGELPNETLIDNLKTYLSDKNRKALTDSLQVGCPESIRFEINLKYYISASSQSQAINVQQQVNAAILEYRLWQISKIGRDINPDELITRVINAGAKRVEVIAPVFTKISDNDIAQCASDPVVLYGGIEDD